MKSLIFFSFLAFIYAAQIDVGLNKLQPDPETVISKELQYSPQIFYTLYCGHESGEDHCEFPSRPKKNYCTLDVRIVRGDTVLECSCGDCYMSHWKADIELDNRSEYAWSFLLNRFYGHSMDSLKAFQTNRAVGFIVYTDARDTHEKESIKIMGSYFGESGKRQNFLVREISDFVIEEKGIDWDQDLEIKLLH
jgi:hypothetical protein